MNGLRAAFLGATNLVKRAALRVSWRLKRLGHPVPLIVPLPDTSIQDPAETAGATAFTKCSSADEYKSHVTHDAVLLRSRAEFEARIVPSREYFRVRGYCVPCGRETDFYVDFLYSSTKKDGTRVPNWRERLVCHRCKLPNRLRAIADFIEHEVSPDPLDIIYLTEQTTPFYRHLKKRYPKTRGSEFTQDGTVQGKSNWLGVRNEDLTKLSLRDSSVDLICTTDVLEHIPDYAKAISECFRVLKPGGALILSVPFLLQSNETIVRARVNTDGSIEHLLPPEYHGDGTSTKGVLCYYHFGWDLLDSLRSGGFSSAAVYFFWSSRRGYMGGSHLMCATKSRAGQPAVTRRDASP
jgi:hypothetical protein